MERKIKESGTRKTRIYNKEQGGKTYSCSSESFQDQIIIEKREICVRMETLEEKIANK